LSEQKTETVGDLLATKIKLLMGSITQAEVNEMPVDKKVQCISILMHHLPESYKLNSP
jgi:hypothetical protein